MKAKPHQSATSSNKRAIPRLPPDRRRRIAVRHRSDRVAVTLAPSELDDFPMSAHSTSYSIDADFDDFGEDIEHLVGYAPSMFDDEDNNFGP